jgi:DNA polymerase-3 subunit gamma/tau
MISAQAWNRTYRPRQVAELHLTSVRQELQRFLKQGKIPQALLFAGPKGTGKTSASRIIGATLNDQRNETAVQAAYYGEGAITPFHEPDPSSPMVDKIISGNSFVVIELDAASNRGIDDVRLLKERVQLPPQGALMAVYILDEVHMLTTEAFNALLKLLEEPPAHAVFILATTELHKIPGTIVSRCHLVQFSRATEDELSTALAGILKQENIPFDAEALTAIAGLADGSFRDAVKLLESVSAHSPLTLEVVTAQLSTLPSQAVRELVEALLAKNPQRISELFATFRSQNVSPKMLHTELLSTLHRSLLASLGVTTETPLTTTPAAHYLLTQLAGAELSTASPIPLLPLELKLLEVVLKSKAQATQKSDGAGSNGSSGKAGGSGGSGKASNSGGTGKSGSTGASSPTDSASSTDPANSESSPKVNSSKASSLNDAAFESLLATVDHPAAESVLPTHPSLAPASNHRAHDIHAQPLDSVLHATPVSTADGDGKLLCEKWPEFVRAVGERNMTVAALLQSAQPLEGSLGSAKIQVFYKFHQEQLSQPKFLQLTDACVREISGGRIEIEYVLSQPPEQAEVMDAQIDEKLEKLATDALM